MPNWFAIHKISDGALVSQESDDSAERLTAPQLAGLGLARKAIAGAILDNEVWNPSTLVKENRVVVNSTDKTRALALLATASGTWTATDRDDAMKLIFKGLNKLLQL